MLLGPPWTKVISVITEMILNRITKNGTHIQLNEDPTFKYAIFFYEWHLCVWHPVHLPESGSPMHRTWSLWCHWEFHSSAEYDCLSVASVWPSFTLQYYHIPYINTMPCGCTYQHHNYKTLILYTYKLWGSNANSVDFMDWSHSVKF